MDLRGQWCWLLVIALASALGLAACQKKEEPPTTQQSTNAAPKAPEHPEHPK
jgi:hypothetical protein